jgi:hypothetical protein
MILAAGGMARIAQILGKDQDFAVYSELQQTWLKSLDGAEKSCISSAALVSLQQCSGLYMYPHFDLISSELHWSSSNEMYADGLVDENGKITHLPHKGSALDSST